MYINFQICQSYSIKVQGIKKKISMGLFYYLSYLGCIFIWFIGNPSSIMSWSEFGKEIPSAKDFAISKTESNPFWNPYIYLSSVHFSMDAYKLREPLDKWSIDETESNRTMKLEKYWMLSDLGPSWQKLIPIYESLLVHSFILIWFINKRKKNWKKEVAWQRWRRSWKHHQFSFNALEV